MDMKKSQYIIVAFVILAAAIVGGIVASTFHLGISSGGSTNAGSNNTEWPGLSTTTQVQPTPQITPAPPVVKQQSQESSASVEATDSATAFQMKAQCQTLGQQKYSQEEQNAQVGVNLGVIETVTAKYGYSQSLNTCLYATWDYYYFEKSQTFNGVGIITDLMTGSIESKGYANYNDLMTAYNALVNQ
jgi:hypothetical protein